MADVRPAADGARGPARHDDHDPELIASLLDRDLADNDRVVAEARVAACSTCAALEVDLRILAKATIALPVPTRLRDFSLAPAVAAALSRGMAREPIAPGSRLAGEMRDSRPAHAAHDRLLIANLVDRSVAAAERARGEEQMAACRDCALLYDDLVALSGATRALPVPLRPRDFTLTSEDAERLRVRGWRRLLEAIGSSRDVFSRPLALGLTTLGLAGLLVATIPSVLTGGTASSPEALFMADDAARSAAGAAEMAPETSLDQATSAPAGPTGAAPAAAAEQVADPSMAPESLAPEAMPLASAESGTNGPEDQGFTGGNSSQSVGEPDGSGDLLKSRFDAGEPVGPSPMTIVAGLMLLAGLGLFGLRWAARRVAGH